MDIKPILFNTEMVRAILDGRKTQTRRPLKPQPPECEIFFFNTERHPRTFVARRAEYQAPFFKDDLLYVREAWCPGHYFIGIPSAKYIYRADAEKTCHLWRPSIHMPKSAARIWLRVKRVAVQRIPDISEEEAKAEGVSPVGSSYKVAFWETWRKIYGWNTKWAWVIEFERTQQQNA